MFRRLRIALLLYVLLFAAAAQYFTASRVKGWDHALWVAVYPVNGDGNAATQRYLDNLTGTEFNDLEPFFSEQAKRYGLRLQRPVRVTVYSGYSQPPPALGPSPSAAEVLVWSLRMRWARLRLTWHTPGPAADVVVYAVFFDAGGNVALDRSTALQKGMIAVANLFASRSAEGSNQVVLAHELLHTLGATDKYDPATDLPRFPDGFAAPKAKPLWPQTQAELMAGRIPLGPNSAEIPASLRQAVVGPATAIEIGWLKPRSD